MTVRGVVAFTKRTRREGGAEGACAGADLVVDRGAERWPDPVCLLELAGAHQPDQSGSALEEPLAGGARLQQTKEELGLNHFEGRSWRGFHHHASLVMLAYGFLALEQLRVKEAPASPGEKRDSEPRITLPAVRRAPQELLRPTAKPDCTYCNPYAHVFDRISYHLTE